MINILRNNPLRGSALRWARRAAGILAGVLLLVPGAANAQLSGTYTICATGCDYSTIQEAADSLKTNGVSGAVTMEIQPGVYNEDVTVGAITGVSATNTVTFKGTGTKNTDVHIYKGSNSAAWFFDGASWVTLENVRVNQVTHSGGYFGINVQYSKNCVIRNCFVTLNTGGSLIQNHEAVRIQYSQDILFKNNRFRGGPYICIGNGNTNTGNARNIFDGNILSKFYYYGMYLWYDTDNQYLNNIIDSATTSPAQMGIAGYFSYGNTVFKGNRIKGFYYGIYSLAYGNTTIDSNYVDNCYYLMTQGMSSTSDATVTRNIVTNARGYGLMLYGRAKLEVYNNMVSGNGSYGMYVYPLISSASIDVAHNTVNWGSNSAIYFPNYNNAKDVKIRNNLMTGNGAGIYAQTGITQGNIIDGNNTIRGSGFYGNIGGAVYNNVADWQTALANYNTGYQEQSTAVTLVSSTDLHLDHTDPAPFAAGIGIGTDIDGDVRCAIMPTVGADETKNTTGDNFKKITGTKFTGSTKAVIGYPTTFFNSAPSTSRLGYRWYVDGVKVSDSFHLRTTALKWPKGVIKLEAYNCSSVDTFVMNVTVDSPATAPTADFVSDVSVIRQGDLVTFTDLSSGYPSAWEWEITPLGGVLNGNPVAAWKYVYGDTNTYITQVRFDVAGKYKVCLTASNVKGKGAKVCKVDYIEVQPSVTMTTSLQVLSASSGTIYDNGGPNGNPTTAPASQSRPKVLIDACADSVYLVFKMFDMYCGYQYVSVYEGKDKQTGKPLTCTGNAQFGQYGPGLTGSATQTSCSYNCSPIRKGATAGTFVYDTFKASKYMYIEMQANTTGSYKGFEAYYWIKPRTQPKPDASFSSLDSVCTNGQVIFTNTTTGADVTYLWDLDDDMSFFEATSKNTNWPYFAPGSYKVTLIAMNCGGADTFTKTINVFNPKAPVTSFTADNVTPTTSDVVFFSKDMPMCVDDYKWTITAASGSGKAIYVNGSRNTSPTPNVMFSDTGCYNVSLYSKNTAGEDSLKLNCFIKVRGSYCVPATQNKAADLGISLVKFNTINNTSSQGVTPYSNFALDQTKSTIIEIGVTYDLTVARNTNKNKITRTAWIDWNADGDFDDAGEEVGEQTNSSTLSWTTPVKVPTLAKTGATVLRIAVNQGTQTNTACGPNVFGEFEDYRIYVRPDATKPVITMLGDDTVFVEQGFGYTDAGATAEDNLDGNITAKIKVSNLPKFDNMTPATYFFKYNVLDAAGNQANEATRVVIVTPDKTGPDLVVPKPDTIYVDVFDPNFTAPDAVLAEDLVDGDLLGEVQTSGNVDVNIVGTYEVVYSVTDASGNTSTVKRTVIVRDVTLPVMTLNGNATVTHEVGTPYTDDSVTVSDNYYSEADLKAALVVQNNVDINTLGTYTVVYTLTDPSGNGPVTVTRTVIVVDTQVPTVTVQGEDPYVLEVNNTFPDPGVMITDNHDKALSGWDTSGTFYATFANGFADQLGTYTVIYEVTDASGNVTTVTRTVIVKDMTAPAVMLKGMPTETVCRWETYTDAGVDATDNFNDSADLTVTTEGSFTVDGTMVAGLWSLRYRVEDKSGNVAYTDWRAILVLEPGQGECLLTGIGEGSAADRYVNVYPNPSTGKFTVRIDMPKAEETRITVTDLVGRQVAVVAEGMMSVNTLDVDLSGQPGGVYMLNIQTATQNVVKRIVINR